MTNKGTIIFRINKTTKYVQVDNDIKTVHTFVLHFQVSEIDNEFTNLNNQLVH